jgi:hypothetical protein
MGRYDETLREHRQLDSGARGFRMRWDRCNIKEPKMGRRTEDIEAIKQLAADWRSGWLADDTEALLSLYSDERGHTLNGSDADAIQSGPSR